MYSWSLIVFFVELWFWDVTTWYQSVGYRFRGRTSWSRVSLVLKNSLRALRSNSDVYDEVL